MPLFNKAATVERAIRSALTQTIDSFELVVIDDGSTDAGAETVRNIGDPRIRMIRQSNAGVSAARNAGIEAAHSDLIAFLDADDEWRPAFLAAVLDLRRRFPQCRVYGTSYDIRLGGTVRPARVRRLPEGFRDGVLGNYFEVASRSDPPLWTSAVAVQRKAIQEAGGFPLGVSTGEDLLTWARLAVRFQIAYRAEPLATFWAPENAYHRPGRVPAVPDRVGEELTRLLEEHRPRGFRDYLAMWHRMRGATFLQLADVRQARRELTRAARLGRMSGRLAVLLAVSLLPGSAAREAYAALRHLGPR
jgi:hypothetical protein